MQKLQVTNRINSLELVQQINMFRGKIEGKAALTHQNLLKVIRDEFNEEIGSGEILPTPYVHPQNKQTYECFNLTLSQASIDCSRRENK